MAIVERFLAAVNVAGVHPSNPPAWLIRMLGGPGSSTGVFITEQNALTVSDVYKCVRVISEAVAMLPWKVYRKANPGKVEATQHPLYSILHDEPNDHMTSFVYRECMMNHLLLWGKHFAYIERSPGSGKIVAIWPLRPDRVRPERSQPDGQLWWYVRSESGQESKFWDDEIVYTPAMTLDGFNAISPIRLHAEALGLAKATEIYGGKFFGNGAHFHGFLSHPQTLKKEVASRIKEQWEQAHRGVDNAHRIAVLEEGITFQKMSIPPNDAQFLETRKYQRTEIAGIFRVPPHKIGDLERGTFSNIEQQNIEFYTDSVTPWLERIEQSYNRSLLLPSEKKKYFNRFFLKGILRGDTAARTAHYKDMFDRGIYNGNTIREMEDENPVEGLDRYYVPMNFVPVDLVDQVFGTTGSSKSSPAESDSVDARAPILKVCGRFFRDAAGRVLKREPVQRQKYAEMAFVQPVLAVMECVLGAIPANSEQFAASLAAQIAARSVRWTEEDAQYNGATELGRAIEAVLKHRFES